jgi:hypothetical protein
MDICLREESETKIAISFLSAWWTTDGVFRALARAHPDVSINAKAAEQGNDFSYRFTSQNGDLAEEVLPWSPEFMASMGIEVDEEGNEIFDDDAVEDESDVENVPDQKPPAFQSVPEVEASRKTSPIIYGALIVVVGIWILFGLAILW